MKLYFDHSSEPSRAVYLFLKYNNIDFEPVMLDLWTGENKTPEYEKINPFQLVPVIDDDGFILTESVAILRYLATKFNAADHWFPKDVQKQARVDEFLNWYHTNIRKDGLALLFYKFLTKMPVAHLPQIPENEEQLKTLRANLAKSVKFVDEYFLKGKPFIAGDEISAADLLGYCELLNQELIDDDTYLSNANVNAWMKRVASKLEGYLEENLAVLEKYKALYAQVSQKSE